MTVQEGPKQAEEVHALDGVSPVQLGSQQEFTTERKKRKLNKNDTKKSISVLCWPWSQWVRKVGGGGVVVPCWSTNPSHCRSMSALEGGHSDRLMPLCCVKESVWSFLSSVVRFYHKYHCQNHLKLNTATTIPNSITTHDCNYVSDFIQFHVNMVKM